VVAGIFRVLGEDPDPFIFKFAGLLRNVKVLERFVRAVIEITLMSVGTPFTVGEPGR
jgi:hypothetical protein